MGTPVSGPGQFSQRTDKAVSGANDTLPNAQYGENKDYQDQKSGAPMAQQGGGVDFNAMFGNPAGSVVGLGEPTQQPGTPVTDGAALGPGAGSEAINTPADPSDSTNAAYLVALQFLANQPGSSDAARNNVRIMLANQ